MTCVWYHLAFTWSSKPETIQAFVNGDRVASDKIGKMSPIPGDGTLYISKLRRDEEQLGLVGFITEFHIHSRAFSDAQVQLTAAQLHGGDIAMKEGDWLSWTDVLHSGKMFGKTRRMFGSECTNFESTC